MIRTIKEKTLDLEKKVRAEGQPWDENTELNLVLETIDTLRTQGGEP